MHVVRLLSYSAFFFRQSTAIPFIKILCSSEVTHDVKVRQDAVSVGVRGGSGNISMHQRKKLTRQTMDM